MATSDTTSNRQWQRVKTNYKERQRMKMSDNGWQRGVILANFLFFQIRDKPTTMHPQLNKEKTKNIRDDLEESLLN